MFLLEGNFWERGHLACDERLGISLTNALEELPEGQATLPSTNFIVEEGTQARAIKQDTPVMVILGNPPYSYESVNTGEWISRLVCDYYQVDDALHSMRIVVAVRETRQLMAEIDAAIPAWPVE